MPAIPQIQQEIRLRGPVEANRMQGARFSDATGVGLSELARGTDALFQGMLADKIEHDTTAVNEAYATGFSPAVRKTLYDPTDGYYSKQGRDALTALPAVQQQITELAKQTRDGLQNDNQRRIFDEISRRHLASELEAANRHANRENQVWQAQTSDAVVTNQRNAAIDRFNDPEYVRNAISSGLYEIETYGRTHGQAPEKILERSRAFIRDTRTAITERLINADPEAAEKYLKDNAAELAGPALPVLEARVKAAVLPVQAKRVADAAMTAPDAVKTGVAMQIGGEPAIEATARQAFGQPRDVAPGVAHYGGAIDAAAQRSGVDPGVMRAQLTQESQGNIRAVSSKGAQGIAQFMPDTAKRYGIDPNVPEQAIDGQARYMADLLKMFGGDYQKALAGYNWGEGNVQKAVAKYGDNWLSVAPKETRDYVATIMANVGGAPVRTAFQGTRDTRANLTQWIGNAEAMAERERPGDVTFRDAVVQQVRGRVATLVAQQEGVQRQAQGALLQASMGTNGQNGPTSLSDLLAVPGAREAYAMIDPAAQRGIIGLLEHNARQAAGEFVRSNPVVLRQLFDRVHLADENDPQKIRNATQLAQYFGQINRTDYDWLKKEIETSRTPEGNVFLRDVQNVRQAALRVMRAGIVGQMLAQTQPEKIEEAAYAFNLSLDRKIDAYRKDGKDPRLLITPGTPDYVLAPGNVASFLQTPQAALGDAAARARGAQPVAAPSNAAVGTIRPAPIRIATEAEFAALAKGARFIGPDGKERVKP